MHFFSGYDKTLWLPRTLIPNSLCNKFLEKRITHPWKLLWPTHHSFMGPGWGAMKVRSMSRVPCHTPALWRECPLESDFWWRELLGISQSLQLPKCFDPSVSVESYGFLALESGCRWHSVGQLGEATVQFWGWLPISNSSCGLIGVRCDLCLVHDALKPAHFPMHMCNIPHRFHCRSFPVKLVFIKTEQLVGCVFCYVREKGQDRLCSKLHLQTHHHPHT